MWQSHVNDWTSWGTAGRTQGQDVRKRVIKDEKTGHAEGMREKRQSELTLQPQSDECVWWFHTWERDGALKCHWTFQSASLWLCCLNPTHDSLHLGVGTFWPDQRVNIIYLILSDKMETSTSCQNDGFLIVTAPFEHWVKSQSSSSVLILSSTTALKERSHPQRSE